MILWKKTIFLIFLKPQNMTKEMARYIDSQNILFLHNIPGFFFKHKTQ